MQRSPCNGDAGGGGGVKGRGGEGDFKEMCTLGEGQWSGVKGAGRTQRLTLAQPPALPCHQAHQSLVAGQAC